MGLPGTMSVPSSSSSPHAGTISKAAAVAPISSRCIGRVLESNLLEFVFPNVASTQTQSSVFALLRSLWEVDLGWRVRLSEIVGTDLS